MRINDSIFRILTILSATMVVVGIILLIYFFRTDTSDDTVTVGALFIGSPDDRGWNESHYEGIKYACDENDCKLIAKGSVSEEEEPVKKAVRSLIREGCSVVFLTSYGYSEYVTDLAQEYPNTAFYILAGTTHQRNSTSYFARIYQARYLAGIVAGAATESGKLGYVSSTPIPETIRSINAYALGVRKANPDAKVYVKYIGSWEDKDAEFAATEELAAMGADVMTYHQDRPYVVEKAEEMGLYSIGYDAVYDKFSPKMLTASVFDWNMVYEKIISDHLSGRANFNKTYWLGLEEEAISLYPYSELVTDETRELVASEKERIMTWRDVFSGVIYDNQGRLRCDAMECIGDDELFNEMDWYVEGVEIYE